MGWGKGSSDKKAKKEAKNDKKLDKIEAKVNTGKAVSFKKAKKLTQERY
ncbi:hypothetical protein [Kribbella sp. CA-294648]